MKNILLILFCLVCAVTASGGSPFAFSGSSSRFIVDTRPDVVINDVTSDYCSGEYGGHGGTRQTFISGVHCDITFKIHASGRDNNPINYYLVNGQRHDSPNLTFDVGSLSPGGRLTVIGVDYLDKKSKPFRVNLEVAPAPTMWNSAWLATIVAEKHPKEGCVIYKAPEGQLFSLFNAIANEVDVGGADLPLTFGPSFTLWQTADSSTSQYKEGVDIGGEWGNDEVELFGKLGGLEISLGITGGVVYEYNPRAIDWALSSSELGFKLGGAWKYRQRIPQCPVLYGEIGLAASGEFVFRQHADKKWYGEINLEPLVEISVAVGVAVDFVVDASVYGAGGVYLKASMPGGLDTIYLKGEFGWRYKALSIFENSGIWWEGSHTIYSKSKTSASPRLLKAGMFPPDFVGTSSGFKLIPRDYGDGLVHVVRSTSGRVVLLSASGADDTQILMHDGFPTPQPALAVAGTNAVLVYVRDNAARSDLDRTEIVFREEASDGSWGGETHVWDDGTGDFQPKLVLLPDGTAIAAWANAKQAFADGTPFATVCASLESAVGVRDPQSGTWTCTNLTDDAALDWVPVLKGATNGTAAVAWVRNAAGSYIGTAAQPSDLAVSFYRNGSWSPMAIAVADIGTVLSHDIAWDGERAVLTWAADADGDLSTEDTEIWARSFENGAWSLPVRLSAQTAVATRPSAWYLTNGVPHVVWVQNGALFAADGLTAASGTNVNVTAAAESSIPGDYRISVRENGSATLLWTTAPSDSKSGLEGGIMSADYVPGTGLAVSASLLRRENSLLRNLSGSMGGDDTFRVAFESVAVSTNAEGQLVQGAVDLAVCRRDAVRDVGVTADDCSFAADVDVGVTNMLLVGIQNYGTVASGTFEYRVWAGEGDDKMLLASGESNVPSLSREVVEVPWTPVEGLTNVAFTIEVDVNDAIGDSRRENNTLIWRPDVGTPLLSLRNAKAVMATDTLRLISARIHNDAVAPLPAGMAVKFWRGEIGGELIGTDTAGLVSGGNGGEYDVGVAWDITGVAFTSEWERVVIELPAEQGGRSVAVWTPTPLYDPENDIEPGGGGGSGGGSGGTPSAPPNIGGIVGFGVVDGSQHFHFYFYGEEGFTYLVQYKEKLTDAQWTTIETVTPSTTGECPVAVPIVTSAPSGFYRVITNP